MELRRLRYFVVVAEELHFTKAADRLNMSQPPLSQQIKMLENEVGAQLLHRTKRSVSLTPAGRDLYEKIVPWLAELDNIAGRVRRIGQGEEGQLNVTCSFSTAQTVLPRVVQEFRASHPKITLKVREMPLDMQLDAITRGVIDVGIMRLPVDNAHLISAPLYDEALMVALPEHHALAAKPLLALRDLRNETFLKASHQSAALFESVEAICRRAGFKARVSEVSSNLNTAMGLVAVGMGIALIPESVRWARPDGVAYVALRDSPRSTVAAVWRREEESAAVQWFVDIAKKIAAEGVSMAASP